MDQNQTNLVPASTENGAVVVAQPNGYEHCLELSRIYSKSGLVPQSYQDKPQDCFVAISMAQRMDLDPLFVMQNLYDCYVSFLIVPNQPSNPPYQPHFSFFCPVRSFLQTGFLFRFFFSKMAP